MSDSTSSIELGPASPFPMDSRRGGVGVQRIQASSTGHMRTSNNNGRDPRNDRPDQRRGRGRGWGQEEEGEVPRARRRAERRAEGGAIRGRGNQFEQNGAEEGQTLGRVLERLSKIEQRSGGGISKQTEEIMSILRRPQVSGAITCHFFRPPSSVHLLPSPI